MDTTTDHEPPNLSRHSGLVLLAAIFIAAVCALVYELLAGTLSSYLLGDSVTQFSLTIGLFLTAMGVGSFLSRFVRRDLLGWIIGIESAIGLIGGLIPLIGFCAFAFTHHYTQVLLLLIFVVGALIGVEIPLVIRILREWASLRVTVATVLGVDYAGALVASVLFPFVLVPYMSLAGAGLVCGAANVLIAGVLLWRFWPMVRAGRRVLVTIVTGALLILGAGSIYANQWVRQFENRLYQDEVIYAADSPYQRIVITRYKQDVRLYLNGHLQFSTIDEHHYHEALVHPAMTLLTDPSRVLILGGGDGLAAREALKYSSVDRLDLVDIDPVVTGLFKSHPMFATLNRGSLRDERVHIHHADAFKFMQDCKGRYDLIVIDLPDPSQPQLGKLYSTSFYALCARQLNPKGVLVTQATSPYRSRKAFWCIKHTMETPRWGGPIEERLYALAYHTHVPSFGAWGFVMARREPLSTLTGCLRVPTRCLTDPMLATLSVFPKTMAETPTAVSRLNDPVVVHLYQQGYSQYFD